MPLLFWRREGARRAYGHACGLATRRQPSARAGHLRPGLTPPPGPDTSAPCPCNRSIRLEEMPSD